MDHRLLDLVRRPVVRKLLLCLALIGLVSALGPAAARRGPTAQAQVDWPRLDLTLYAESIELAAPTPGLSAALYRAGRLQAYAATLPLGPATTRLTLRPEAGQEDAVLRPGDRLELRHAGQRRSLTIPVLAGIIDRRAGEVAGRAPVTGTLTMDDPRDNGNMLTLKPDSQGRFTWRTGAGGSLTSSSYTRLLWLAPNADLTLGLDLYALSVASAVDSPSLDLTTSLGDRVTASLSSFDGLVLAQAKGEMSQRGVRWAGGQGPRSWPPLRAGNQIAVLAEAAGLGQSQSLLGVVPPLSLRIDPFGRVVSGRIGPNASYRADLMSTDGEMRTLLTLRLGDPDPVDGGRSFVAPIPDGWKLDPGATVSIRLWDDQGTSFSALAAIPKLTLRPAEAVAQVLSNTGHPITITWSTDAGELLGQRSILPSAGGHSLLKMGAPDGRGFVVSDRLQLDLGDGDPRSLRLPPFSAKTDAAAMVLAGEGPIGSRVLVGQGPRTQWDIFINPPQALTADDEGRYALDLRVALDEPDLEAGDAAGDVVLQAADWVDIVQPWGAPKVWMDLQSGAIAAVVPTPCTYEAVLRGSGAGELVGRLPQPRWLEAYDPGQVIWTSGALDAWGQTVVPQPRDLLSLRACDETAELTVPRLELDVDLAASQVRLRGEPRQELSIDVERMDGGGDSRRLRTNAAGEATVDFEDIPLQANDRILVTANDKVGLEVYRRVVAHGLRVDLDSGQIRGQWLPGRALAFRWLRGDASLAAWETGAGPDGRVDTQVPRAADQGGLQAGDRISLVDGAEPPLLVTVPDFSLALDATDRRNVAGSAPPGAEVMVMASAWLAAKGPDADQRPDWKRGSADSQGRWSARLDAADFDRVTALISLPEGHVLTRSAARPVGLLQLGAAAACGLAGQAGAAVAAEVRAADGRLMGSAAGRAMPDGSYWLPLVGEGGGPLVTAEGQLAHLRVGGAEVSVSLPRWQAQLDWQTGRVQGYGPPEQTLTFRRRDGACPRPAPDAWHQAFLGEPAPEAQPHLVQAATSPSGWFQADLTPLFPPGAPVVSAVEATWSVMPDLYLGALLPREQLRIFSRGERLTTFSAPGFPQQLALMGPDGQLRATAMGIPGADGWLGLHWRSPAGEPVAAAPGDRVQSSSLGGNQSGEGVLLPELNLDWSPGEPLVMQSGSHRTIVLQLVLADGREVQLTRDTDASGRISLDPATLPPRTPWAWAAVQGIQAELRLDDRHTLIAQVGRLPAGVPPPERPAINPPPEGVNRAWLPMLVRPADR